MKFISFRILSIAALLATLALPAALGADGDKPTPPPGGGPGGGKRPDRGDAARPQRDAWLKEVGASEEQAAKIREILKDQMEQQKALRQNGWLIQVATLDDGVALANRLAPEHCEVMTRRPADLAERILTAGAIFLGGWSPTVLGDYVAGPSHTLPTGGAGASFAGLTVDQFQRRTSVVEYDKAALRKSLPALGK